MNDGYNVVWSREAIYDVADIADCIELHLRQHSVQGGNAK